VDLNHIGRRGMVPFSSLGHRYSTSTRGHYEIVPDALPEDRDFFYIELEPVDAVEMPSRKRIVATSFLLTHDLFRGLLQTTHALFSYTLMLAMMSVSDRSHLHREFRTDESQDFQWLLYHIHRCWIRFG